MLYGIIGKKGAGKTLFLTYLLKKYSDSDNKVKIYTNYTLKGINFEEINFKEIFKNDIEIKNAIVGIDEIYLIADCRTSMTKMNKLISYLLYQTRKAGVDIFYTAVSYSTIDIRLRRGTDGIFFPNLYVDGKKVLNPESLTRIKMDQIIKRGCLIQLKGLFHTEYATHNFSVDNPQNYFKYYSSYQMIKPTI